MSNVSRVFELLDPASPACPTIEPPKDEKGRFVKVVPLLLILLSAIPPAIWALKRVPPENKCAHCGSAMPAGAIFCPTCKTPTA